MSHRETGTRDKPLIQQALAIEHRVALCNCSRIDPGDLDEYIAVCQGYSGLESALQSDPESVIAQLGAGGLGGSGNAGLDPLAEWQVCRDTEGDEKYAVCNAVDADPRSNTARLLLAGDPHSVLEGLLIGAYVVGARRAFVGVNADYGEEIALVRQAIEQMRERGLLGEDVLGSGFSLDVTVMEVTGSLVAGEDTALLQALEGRQMVPYLRLESLAVKGLYGKPTLIESAETFSKVASAQRLSSAQQSSGILGAARSSGTKVVTVHGLSHETTLEVPLGTTVGMVIEAVEGAPLSDLDIKAVQFGGPTGRFLAGDQLDTPITAEAMAATGTAMGSGSIKVFPGDLCAVETARDAMSYLHEQSCGKCVACREGTHQLLHILNDLAEFKAGAPDIELILELGAFMGSNSICDVGRNASAPVLSAIELFAADYKAHMDDKRCPGDQAHG